MRQSGRVAVETNHGAGGEHGVTGSDLTKECYNELVSLAKKISKCLHHFLLFRLFPSGVATADFPSPVVSINCILLHHFNLSHVLFHHIHKPPFGLPRFLFPGNSILSIRPPIYPSYFLHRCPNQLSLASRVFSPNPCCPSDVLIPDLTSPFLSLLMKIVTSSTLRPPSCLFVSATVSTIFVK